MSEVKSLRRLATEAAINGIRQIHDIGEVPYSLIRPVLMKIGNPMQLKELEDASPQIIGADEEIWLMFIKRDIPDWQSKAHRPRSPADWWKVYRKLKREIDEQTAKQTAALKAVLSKKAEEKEENQMEFDSSLKVPKRSSTWGTYEPRPKPGTGKHIIDKARREARDVGTSRALLQQPKPPSVLRGPGRTIQRPSPTASAQSQPAVQLTREEMAQKRERALAQARVASNVAPASSQSPLKRKAPSVLLPGRKRRP